MSIKRRVVSTAIAGVLLFILALSAMPVTSKAVTGDDLQYVHICASSVEDPELEGVDVLISGENQTYTTQTLSNGCAALELPLGKYDLMYYNTSTGEYVDGTMEVVVPSPYATGPQTETVLFYPGTPKWSFEQTDAANKQYHHAELRLFFQHENYEVMLTASVKWFRENVRYTADPTRSFEDGYDAATDDNRGRVNDKGPWQLESDSHDFSSKTFGLKPLQNGRYWVQIHYNDVATGRDIFRTAHVDVDNIYTPVSVYVRDYDETNHTVAKPHTPLPSEENRVGIACDLDGTPLVKPRLGYDTITYTRNENLPAPRWQMIVPGTPFAATSGDASSSVITLSPEAIEETNRPGDSATGLYYTVNYRDTALPYTVTYDPNGGIGEPYLYTLSTNSGWTVAPILRLEHVSFSAADGMIFLGWNTKPDGTGDSCTPGEQKHVNGSLILYAQWQSTVTTVTVSKTIEGPFGDKTRAFSFSILLNDANGKPIGGTFPTTSSDGPLVVVAGKATFTLTHGQTIIISKLPIGGTVRIIDEAPSDYLVSFIHSASGDVTTAGNDTGKQKIVLNEVFSFVGSREAPPNTGLTPGDVEATLLMPATILLVTLPLFVVIYLVGRRATTGRS